jgi:hypothetical protein
MILRNAADIAGGYAAPVAGLSRYRWVFTAAFQR